MRALLCILALVCCSNFSYAQSTTDQPSGTIAVEDSASQDAAIANRIRDIMAELEGYENVTTTVSSGIVTFRGTTLDGQTAARLNDLAARVEGVVAIENEVRETTDIVERLNPAMERFTERMNQVIAFIPLALVALLAFVIVVVIGFLIARLKQPWERLAPNAFIADIYRQILRLAFMVGGLVIALDILGATALLSTILGAAGIIGLAIGFAVRDTVENFIASIMLSIRQPFRPNDSVEIGGDTGKVIRLTSRATILLSFDGNHIRIPNAIVFKSRIINFSRNDERRFAFEVSVSPSTDLALARELALQTIIEQPFVIDHPTPSAWIENLGDSTVTIGCNGWIRQSETSFSLARGEAMRMVKDAFEVAGIKMPEPTIRVLSKDITKRRKAAKKAKKAVKVALEDVTAIADDELEKIIAEERDSLDKEDDLLNKEAPPE